MQAHDEDRFRTELLSYVPRLRAFARALAGSVAAGEDLAQDTVLRAWRARGSFTLGTNMEGWLFRILRNLHISGVRSASARSARLSSEAAVEGLVAVDDPSAGVALNDLRLALNRLSPEQREALILIGASGWSYEEAAAHAGCPVGTMKSRVFRARRTLASHLDSGTVQRDLHSASTALARLAAVAERCEAEPGRPASPA